MYQPLNRYLKINSLQMFNICVKNKDVNSMQGLCFYIKGTTNENHINFEFIMIRRVFKV